MLGSQSLEFSNLNKFMASAGILFMTLGGSVLVASSKIASDGLIKQEDYNNLFEKSKQVVDRRVFNIHLLQEISPIISLILFTTGLIFFIIAIYRWNFIQKSLDSEEIARSEHQLSLYQKGTKEATEEKLLLEVKDMDEEESNRNGLSGAQEEKGKSSDFISTNDYNHVANKYEDTARKYKEVEDDVYEKFSKFYSSEMVDIKREMSLRLGGKERLLDILISPKEGSNYGELGIEVKLVKNLTRVPGLIVRSMEMLAFQSEYLKPGNVITGLRVEPPIARINTLVFCVFENSMGENTEGIFARIDRVNKRLKEPVGVVLVSKEKLEHIERSEFQKSISSIWAGVSEIEILN